MNSTKNEPLSGFEKLQRSLPAIASWQNAQQLARMGRLDQALVSYRNLLQQFPDIPQLWTEFAGVNELAQDFAAASEACQKAADLSAHNAEMMVAVGMQFYNLRNFAQAEACFRRGTAADPGSVRAATTLASWLERNHRLEEAWRVLEPCLAKHPKDGYALYQKAFLLHSQGDDNQAETTLRDLIDHGALLPLEVQANAHHLLGTLQDEHEQYADALQSMEKAKMLRRQMGNASALEEQYDRMSRERRELLAGLTPEAVRSWRDESGAGPGHRLALLGGSPRSGTTLIEQILGANPSVLMFDEVNAFAREVLSPLRPLPPAPALTHKSLHTLPANARARMTERYYKNLLREITEDPGGKLLLDKNPATTPWLYAWIRMFPLSKVIIALRDPRDIVISCYFQNLHLTTQSVNFFSLKRTAQFYTDCMDVWLRMQELGGFDWMEVRYEEVVGNLEKEGRRITSFLGLEWHEDQATYYKKASRKFMDAPTYNAVTKPVYTKAMGRWEHYADALAPVQPDLERHLRGFGYI